MSIYVAKFNSRRKTIKSFIQTVVLLFAAVISTSVAFASCEKLDTVVYGALKTEYVLSNAVVSSDRPVLQGGVTLTCGPNYVDFWGSGVADTTRNPYGREYDIQFGHTGTFGDSVNYLAKVSYFNLESTGTYGGNDILDVALKLSLKNTWGGFTPSLQFESLFSEGFKLNNSIVTTASVDKHFALSDALGFDNQLSVSNQSAVPGVAYKYEGNLAYAVSKDVSSGVSFTRVQTTNQKVGQNVWGVKASVHF